MRLFTNRSYYYRERESRPQLREEQRWHWNTRGVWRKVLCCHNIVDYHFHTSGAMPRADWELVRVAVRMTLGSSVLLSSRSSPLGWLALSHTWQSCNLDQKIGCWHNIIIIRLARQSSYTMIWISLVENQRLFLIWQQIRWLAQKLRWIAKKNRAVKHFFCKNANKNYPSTIIKCINFNFWNNAQWGSFKNLQRFFIFQVKKQNNFYNKFSTVVILLP